MGSLTVGAADADDGEWRPGARGRRPVRGSGEGRFLEWGVSLAATQRPLPLPVWGHGPLLPAPACVTAGLPGAIVV